MGKRESADEIDEAAFRWVARLDQDSDNPDLHTQLTDWLAADSRREGAYLRAQALWLRLDRASQSAEAPAPRISRRQMLAGAATMAAGIGAGIWLMGRGDAYDTTIGEIRHVPLPDGSTAYLNTQSRVQVAMQKKLRRVTLAQGEAWFQVEPDAARPFIVESGAVRVRAVGTAFSVRQLAHGAEVLVSEGVVEAWVDGAEIAAVRIKAGEKALLQERAPALQSVAAPSEIDRKLAWRSGKIDLAGETLAEAAAEFNRYNRREMLIRQAALADKRFYGVFRTDDPEGFVKAVHLSLNVPVEIGKDALIIGK